MYGEFKTNCHVCYVTNYSVSLYISVKLVKLEKLHALENNISIINFLQDHVKKKKLRTNHLKR